MYFRTNLFFILRFFFTHRLQRPDAMLVATIILILFESMLNFVWYNSIYKFYLTFILKNKWLKVERSVVTTLTWKDFTEPRSFATMVYFVVVSLKFHLIYMYNTACSSHNKRIIGDCNNRYCCSNSSDRLDEEFCKNLFNYDLL